MNTCINCTIKFEKKDHRDKGKFCERSCFRDYYANKFVSKRIKECNNCGKQYTYWRETQRYCSNRCELVSRYKNGFKANVENAHLKIKTNGFPQKKGKRIPQLHNQETYKKISIAKTGVEVPKLQGANHPQWKGGYNLITYDL